MKFAGWYGIGVGLLMLAQWTFFLLTGEVTELQTEPIRIAFHLAGEFVTALALIVGSIALLKQRAWGGMVYSVAAGMPLYSVIVSPGYFAQQGQWAFVGMFALLLVLALFSLARVARKSSIRKCTMTIAGQHPLGIKIVIRGLAGVLSLFVLVFVSAGTFDYWQGWLYIILNMGVILGTLFALRNNPQLIEERLAPKQGMKDWDMLYFALTTPLYLGGVILAAVDVMRFGWTPELPLWAYAAGIAFFLLGQAIFLWAKKTNAFFSSVVRIQIDRGQTVCREGPYQYVRHPGYVGSLVWTLAAPLLLGSVWALIPALISDLLLVWRTAKEDETLQRELPGYIAYAQQVKYRLVPGIW